MAKAAALILALFVLPCLPMMGETLEVLPPNETGYSTAELRALLPALERLNAVLSNADLGSQQVFRPDGWTSLDFSAYTGGTLEGRGYTTRLVAADGGPDGGHVWVLVGIYLSGRTAWVPVEATPDLGAAALTLGRLPTTTDNTGRLWFETGYLHYEDEVQLPPNRAPVAVIRTDMTQAAVGQAVTFMALASYDPDGKIIRYYWDLGDGSSALARTVLHSFNEAGDYIISLTVTDSRGARSSASTSLRVVEPRAASTGCGCGR